MDPGGVCVQIPCKIMKELEGRHVWFRDAGTLIILIIVLVLFGATRCPK